MPAVNPKILVWARESAGYDQAVAAKKLQLADSAASTAAEKLAAYESGQKAPSRPMLVKMSKQYRRPLLTFYLSEPPAPASRGEDYRTLTHGMDPSQDAIVDALVRNIRARQEIVRDALISAQEREPLEFVGSFNMDRGVAELVRLIRETAGIELQVYRKQRTQEDAFKYLRTRIEDNGVFALLAGNLGNYHTNLSTEVFRGFALSDDIAPFVVVNDQDAKTAWPVTLLHEVAHLWLGETGISGARYERKIEKFCNEVASEILLPESELAGQFALEELWDRDVAVASIDSFAKPRKLSSRLVAYRLLKRGAITPDQFEGLSRHFYERWKNAKERQKEKNRGSDGGANYYNVKRHRVGSALLTTSERLLRSGELSTTKAAMVLGVRALKVGNMFSRSMA